MAESGTILPIRRVEEVEKRITGNPDARRRPSATPSAQRDRLGGRLEAAFADVLDRDDLEVALDPSAMAPERALVFEIIGDARGFVLTARRAGLEWLAEEYATLSGVADYLDLRDEGEPADDEEPGEQEVLATAGLEDADETPGRLYLGMPTLEAFDKLRALWRQYASGAKAPKDHGDWWALFSRLHDLRVWDARDRLTDAAISFIATEEAINPDEPVRVEIDLWYRQDPAVGAAASAELRRVLGQLGGEVLDEVRIDEIRYHAALVSLPAAAVGELVDRSGDLASADEVMSIHPQAAFRFGVDEPAVEPAPVSPTGPAPAGVSLAALLDGYPVENHHLLVGRLDVVPLEVSDSMAPVRRRFHGTAMASLIVHGDLHAPGAPIGRPLKVIPVLMPDDDGRESPPRDKLALGLILRAVRSLKVGSVEDGPSGRDVIVVNHSICDESAAFAGRMGAWARLLDHLAYEHKVLFVVSAGNVPAEFDLADYVDIPALQGAHPDHRRQAVLRAVEAAKAKRSMYSPAETVNGLTVAAAHADASPGILPANAVDPYGSFAMANLKSGAGLGFNRAVKPDVMIEGGRQSAQPSMSPTLRVRGHDPVAYWGQQVASPDPDGGSTALVRRSSGTSNAAALATRSGLLIADALDEAYGGEEPWHRRATAPCMLKALIAHGAAWGDVGAELRGIYPPIGRHMAQRENIARFIGYGRADAGRIVEGAQNRVTLLADDQIRTGQRHEYRIPLIDELAGIEFRRITFTLAWLSPVRPHSANYRAVGLELVNSDGRSQLWGGVKRSANQPGIGASKRGTLIHAVYEAENRAAVFGPGEDFAINVQATSGLTGVSKLEVPYALAITVEVAASVRGDVRASMRQRVGVRPRVGLGRR